MAQFYERAELLAERQRWKREGKLLVWQRPPTSRLMPGFWELPERTQLPNAVGGRRLGSFRHGITFHSYVFDVYEADEPREDGQCRWISLDDLRTLPVSTILRKAKNSVETARNAATSA